MSLIEILILAIALSLDALIVSFSYGLIIKKSKLKNALLLAFFFGLFQFLMPVLGWFLSSFVYEILEAFSKWIVFTVFLLLGLKFIKESILNKEQEEKIENCISLLCVLLLAVATSIDALGAGISFRFTNISVLKPSLIIGSITFINSFVGFYIASLFKQIPSKVVGITGSMLLFYLAVKALF